jgi:hypothetical protein
VKRTTEIIDYLSRQWHILAGGVPLDANTGLNISAASTNLPSTQSSITKKDKSAPKASKKDADEEEEEEPKKKKPAKGAKTKYAEPDGPRAYRCDIIRTQHSVTLFFPTPGDHYRRGQVATPPPIQIVLRLYSNPAEVLMVITFHQQTRTPNIVPVRCAYQCYF